MSAQSVRTMPSEVSPRVPRPVRTSYGVVEAAWTGHLPAICEAPAGIDAA